MITSKKLSTIIIDDEPNVCDLIKHLGNWQELNIEVIGEANGGQQGLALIRKYKPDIVIIDMRLPGISGIDIIKKCFTEHISSKFLVVSGYKKFEYAQQALTLNVSGYLLKPINKYDLNSALKKIITEIQNSYVAKNHLQTLSSTIDIKQGYLWEQLFFALTEQKRNNIDINKLRKTLGISNDNISFVFFIVKIDALIDTLDINSLLKQINALLKKYFNEQAPFPLHIFKTENRLFSILYYESASPYNATSIFNNIYQLVNKKILPAKAKVTIGISSKKNSFSDLPSAYREATACIEFRRYSTQNIILYTPEIPLVPKEFAVPQKYEDKIIRAIEIQSKEKALQIFNDFWSEFLPTFKPRGSLFITISAFVETWCSILNSYSKHTDFFQKEKYMLITSIDNEMNLNKIKDYVSIMIKSSIKQYADCHKSWGDQYIRTAKKYIAENLGNGLTLDEVAEAVSLNPIYFSSLFKTKTEMNFSSYIQKQRIDMAKQLLQKSKSPIKVISSSVGYQDINYFTKLFKRYVGITPSAYRRMHFPI